MKPTPGPWHVINVSETEHDPEAPAVGVADRFGRLLAITNIDPSPSFEAYPMEAREANARLIAAAPQLRELLLYAVASLVGGPPPEDDAVVEMRVSGRTVKEIREVLATIEGKEGGA